MNTRQLIRLIHQIALTKSLGLIIIPLLQQSTSGQWFKLEAINSYLNVTSPAKITQPPMSVAVASGEVALFLCRASGNPKPKVEFLVDPRIDRINRRGTVTNEIEVQEIPNGSLLRITNVRSDWNGDDKVQVECVARNNVGSVSSIADLSVIDSGILRPRGFPEIVEPPRSVTRVTRDSARLTCEVTGEPQPTVVWLKNKIPLQLTKSRVRLIDTGTLVFDELDQNDNGDYECWASNSVGGVLSHEVRLVVQNSYFAPRIDTQTLTANLLVRSGGDTNLTCRATGNPLPATRWLTEGKRPLTEPREGDSVLPLADITQSSVYRCQANNSLGSVSEQVRIEVMEVPSPPHSLTCLEQGPTYAFLQWFQSKSKPVEDQSVASLAVRINSYTLFLDEYDRTGHDGPGSKIQLTDIPTRQYSIERPIQYKVEGLKPFRLYSVEVVAVSNQLGMSDASNRIKFRTAEQAPSSAPVSISSMVLYNGTLILKWEPPIEANGLIENYTVRYASNNAMPLDRWNQRYVVKSRQIGLENLKQTDFYYVRLQAHNSAGDGPLSDAIPIVVKYGGNSKQQNKVPSQPVDFTGFSISPNRIYLSWKVPDLPEVIRLQPYMLSYRPFDQRGSSIYNSNPEQSIAPDQTSYVVDSLIPNQTYHLSLTATSAYGPGSAAQITVRTQATTPNTPILNQLQVLDSSHIFLAWSSIDVLTEGDRTLARQVSDQYRHLVVDPPPSQPIRFLIRWTSFPFTSWNSREVDASRGGSAVQQKSGNDLHYNYTIGSLLSQTHYRIELIAVGPSQGRSQPLRIGPVKTKGLKFGRVYQFEVAAFNADDVGQSAVKNFSIPKGVHGNYPTHVSVHGLSSSSVKVTWSPPQIPDIQHYEVRYFQPHDQNRTEVVLSCNEAHTMIDGLSEQTHYTIMVRSVTPNGPGEWSRSVRIRTTVDLPAPPTSLAGVRINPYQIKITWLAHKASTTSPNPIVTGYQLHYAQSSSGYTGQSQPTHYDLLSWKLLDLGPVGMATLDDLDPLSNYIVKVRSRASDGRYGPFTDPITVVREVDAGTSIDPIGGGSIDESRLIRRFTCHWIDSNEPGMAARLKLTWSKPHQSKDLKMFKLDLQGSQAYINQKGNPSQRYLQQQSIDVPLGALNSPVMASNPASLYYIQLPDGDARRGHQQPYEYIVDGLEANTVYDVTLKPVYDWTPSSSEHAPRVRTSCSTAMQPPREVGTPKVLATNQERGSVKLRLFRVNEQSGRIQRYYLVLAESADRILMADQSSIVHNLAWQQRTSSTNPTAAFIAVEYSQDSFTDPYFDLVLEGKKKTSDDRSFDHHSVVDQASELFDVQIYPNLLHADREYKAFSLACIYPNEPPSYSLNRLPLDGSSKVTTEASSDHASTLNFSLCMWSNWSHAFNPSLPFVDPSSSSSTDLDQLGGAKGRQGRSGLYTILVIVGLVILLALAVLAFALICLMRRRKRRSKLLLPDSPLPSSHHKTIPSSTAGDGAALKTPLINNSHHLTQKSQQRERVGDQQEFAGTNGTAIVEQSGKTDRPTGPPPTVKIRKPIPINELARHLQVLKRNSAVELSNEYECIESDHRLLTWKHASLEANRAKNRYANIVPYDHTRVVLGTSNAVTSDSSDYINANYIDGYQRPKAYIATQGPTPATFYDFWRMIWEQDSRVIVMITRLEERASVKCDQYWPNRAFEKYSSHVDPHSYLVTLTDTVELAYYTLRTFKVQQMRSDHVPNDGSLSQGHTSQGQSDELVREIKHLQYTAWPDYGTPDQPQSILLFVRRVQQLRAHLMHQLNQSRLVNGGNGGESTTTARRRPTSGNNTTATMPPNNRTNRQQVLGPTIVHCSAGVGRTGAFIAIDTQLERMKHEQTIDLFGCVSQMRGQRNFMVQTEEQYTFLYDVLVEAVTVAGTEITAHSLHNHVMALRRVGAGPATGAGKQSGLAVEFGRLEVNFNVKYQVKTATSPGNASKNRYPHSVAFDSNRVVLNNGGGDSSSDYINASYVDGYRKRRAYIATQTPLPSTLEDFWRLIWQHQSPIIVSLGDFSRQSNQPNVPFWPMERSVQYGALLIEPMVEYNMPNFILREFRLTYKMDGQTRMLRQFEFSGWPLGSPIPKSTVSLIELIGQVHKTQAQFGQDGPMTVHCSSGSDRVGLFVCLSQLLDRMRSEGMVDLFLTTRMLRTQRMKLIGSVDQYSFCYDAALEYLASFDHYVG